MKKLLTIAFLFVASGLCQTTTFDFSSAQLVAAAPAGACIVGAKNQIVTGTWISYSCGGSGIGGAGQWYEVTVPPSAMPCNVMLTPFNAKGDNSTDDSAGINLATATCLAVYFPQPSAKYKMTIPLLIKSGTKIIGTSGPTTNGGSTIAFYGNGPGISGSFTPDGNYVSGGSITGTATQTCNLAFLGGGGGTATVALTGTNTIAANTALSGFAGSGVYNPAPTTATLSSGTATCSGTAVVFIYAPGAGTRNVTIQNMYLEDDYSSRNSSGFGDAIFLDAGTDADANVEIKNNHTYQWMNGLTVSRTLQSTILGNRFDVPFVNGVNQTGLSTSTSYISNYVDAPGVDCYNIQSLSYSMFTADACDAAGRDAYHMDSTNRNTQVAFVGTGMEGAVRYGFLVEGQRLSFVGTSCFVNQYSGTVNTSGTTVTYASGSAFLTNMAGANIIIAGVSYVISSVASGTSMTIATSAGTQTGAAFTIGNHCYYIDNATQITMASPYARYGDYGLYNPNTGALQTTYAGTPIVTVSGLLSDNNNVAQVYDPNKVMTFTDTFNGHASAVGIPTISACGTSPTLTAPSVDTMGTINVGTGSVTACTLTFKTAFTAAPSCRVNADSAATVYPSSVSTTAVTFTASTSVAAGHLYYACR